MNPTIKYRRLICAGADPDLLMNESHLRDFLYRAALECGCTPEQHYSYQFPTGGKGISSILIVGESHIIAHTWPEHNFFTVSAETCGDKVDLGKLEIALQEFFPDAIIDDAGLERESVQA